MPYPNEHACRLIEPGKVKTTGGLTFRHDGKRYRTIIGAMKATGKKVTQAIRYPKKIWTAASARAHCKSKGGKFEAAAGTTQDYVHNYEERVDNPLIP